MNAAIRAHRILAALANYQKAEQTDSWPLKLAASQLGEPIGCYRNPGSDGEVIGIFANGLTWLEGTDAVGLLFRDIAEVTLPSGKQSEGLLLKMRNGWQHQLPVKGQRGKFFDSMEMLRFLNRVMQDLRGQEPEASN
jgi:hypothetical protein